MTDPQQITMTEQDDDVNTITIQHRAAPVRRCRQCREAGHDIRNCPLSERIHREGVVEYNKWITHCIVDYHLCNKWKYDLQADNGYLQIIPNDLNLLQLFIDNQENENPLENVLKTPTTWIQSKTVEHLRVLAHVYGFPKTEPYKSLSKEVWASLLHFIMFMEVEQLGTRQYEVKTAVPYIATSIQCFSVLETIHQHILTLPLMLPEVLFKPNLLLRPISERYTRIRDMRTNTTRNLRLTQQDLNENYREENGIRRRMTDLRVRRARVENESRRIETNVVKYENEMILFMGLPPEPPKITFHKRENNVMTEIICSICYEPTRPLDTVNLACKHEFCASCIFLTISGKFKEHTLELDNCLCPYCRREIDKIYGNVANMKLVLKNICDSKRIPIELTRIVGG